MPAVLRITGCESSRCSSASPIPTSWFCWKLWKDQAALDAHAKLQARRPLLPERLRLGAGEREDFLQPYPLNGEAPKQGRPLLPDLGLLPSSFRRTAASVQRRRSCLAQERQPRPGKPTIRRFESIISLCHYST
jgi:hypothetical protein